MSVRTLQSMWRSMHFAVLLALALTGAPHHTLAQTLSDANAGERSKAGSVIFMSGEVSAQTSTGAQQRVIHVGNPVYVGEIIEADPVSEAVIKMVDGGLLAIRPQSKLVVEKFVAQGKEHDAAIFKLFSGGLRLISGWIARKNPAEYKVVTPTSTIGVRGTDHEPYYVPAERAMLLGELAGSYDKVNHGATFMEHLGARLDIETGQVGFGRLNSPAQSRALLTLVLPVILERVPSFYVPGVFEAELDRMSSEVEAENTAVSVNQNDGRPALAKKDPTLNSVFERKSSNIGDGQSSNCPSEQIAVEWLSALDHSISTKDMKKLGALFAEKIEAEISLVDPKGARKVLLLPRTDFLSSSFLATQALESFKHQRVSTESVQISAGSCSVIAIRSRVIESGQQSGQPYRFDSLEEYVIERSSAGKWVASRAKATQN